MVKRSSNSIHLAIKLFVAAVVMSTSASNAQDQFWISLGSFTELSRAEAVRDRAANTFFELSIISAGSPLGLVYRVLEGPMNDRAGANVSLQQARGAGFTDAWVLKQDSSFAPADSLTSTRPTRPTEPTRDDAYSSDYQYERDALADSPSSADYEAVSIGNEELVETAPAGYGLHQLRRSAITTAPGEAPDSRLRELRTLKPAAGEVTSDGN